jgi:molecular chaperone DnaK
MATWLGIDLGTTYSAMATLDENGRPHMVPNREGEILTPSAIYLAPDGRAVVGQTALDMALEQPERVATLVKRFMGRPDYGRPVAGRDFRPETLSAILLKKLVQDAQMTLGQIDGCVITVPAYFDDTRRKATLDAGRIAGLPVLDILDEPTAAALAYAWQSGWIHPSKPPPVPSSPSHPEEPRILMVYDLGGGTFDVTLVKLARQRFQVLAIEGDVRLGGRDWDERLAHWAAEQFVQHFQVDPRDDPQSYAHLLAAAERVKRTLSRIEQTTWTVSHAGQRLTLPITRGQLELLTQDLLLRTRLTVQQLLRHAHLDWKQIEQVLLVGGSTHMPAVTQMLGELSGREPNRSLAVSEVVARGAAIHAGILTARRSVSLLGEAAPTTAEEPPGNLPWEEIVEIHVNAHSLGVEVRNGSERIHHKLVPKNTQLPATAEHIYYTVRENQSRVRVRILQGEAHQAEACIPVGECWIEDLPAGLPKGSPIRVRCGVEANGRIHVSAVDLTTGRAVTATLHRPGGLTDEQIAREADFLRHLRIL